MVKALAGGVRDGSFLVATGVSMRRILIGYGFSAVTGIALGIVIGQAGFIDEMVSPIILGLQSLPSIVWLPMAVLWFGLNESAIIFVVIMGAILSITISTLDGMRNVAPIYLKAAQTLGAKGIKTYLFVRVPAAFPSIISGMKLGWTFAWRSLMAGELIFVSLGFGHLLQVGRELNDINQIVAVMILIVIIGLAIDRGVFYYLERAVRKKWGLLGETL